jgi:hypothetical protein
MPYQVPVKGKTMKALCLKYFLSSRMWWVGEAFKDLRYCLAAKLPQA